MAIQESFIIGIDFGTTYSGVAWCWSGQPDNIQVITRWKTRRNFTSDNAKTPTEIYYDPSGEQTYWGYDIPPDVEPIRWFKLLLVDSEDLTPELRESMQIRRARELLKSLRKTETQVVADYLRLLWKHVTSEIIRERGVAAFRGSPLKIWITVPAIWKHNAQKRMREAAKAAGLLESRSAGETVLELVAEPEAAAMAVLDDFQGRPDIKADDSFVVCDAGGGTADIISYTILNTTPVKVKECVEGKGKMCGAIFVDEAFENMLKSTLRDKWYKMSSESKKIMINNEWEFGIKRLFDDSDQEWSVQVPLEALSHNRFKIGKQWDDKKGEVPMKEGQLKFRRGHIRAFFERVVPHIRGLVHDQINQIKSNLGVNPKAILLVGGLGSCNYLYQQLRKAFENKGITVMQPAGARPWTAICRGAVMAGLSAPAVGVRENVVVSRVSRVNYGTPHHEPFNKDIHLWEDRYWCDEELEWKARGQMDWYLRRGDEVFTKKPVAFEYYQLFQDRTHSINIDIWYNSEDNAPSRITDAVRELRMVNVQVRTPYEELPEWTNSEGGKFRKISYRVEMTSTNVSMKWKVLMDGEELGSDDVEVLRE